MKISIILFTYLVSTCLSSPDNDLFAPFGDFLQGNVIKPNDVFTKKFLDSTDFKKIKKDFASKLDDQDQLDEYFNEFAERFGKTYSTESEVKKRKQIFKSNLLKVFEHNSAAVSGQSSFTEYIGQFADMTTYEFLKRFTGYTPSRSSEQTRNQSTAQPKRHFMASNKKKYRKSWAYDWRSVNVVPPVQNQGRCGACGQFGAAAVVETNWAILGHGKITLSAQQLIDCTRDWPYGNSGCKGSNFKPTFEYIAKHGMTSVEKYPYLAKDAQCDKYKEGQVVAIIKNWGHVVPHGNEEALRKRVENGPVAVAIHVNGAFGKYKQGIFDYPCQGGRNHGVLVVGYGYDKAFDMDYWIVKNQWGTHWGEKGYIRMRRNHGNMCDIAGDAVWVQ